MKISTKIRYALRALVDLAVNYKGEPVKINEIAERQGLSLRYLENLFTVLREKEILNSRKGKNGGFYLAKPLKDITALNIFEAVGGKLSILECLDDANYCERISVCPTHELWDSLNKTIASALNKVTLDNLVKEYKSKEKNKKI